MWLVLMVRLTSVPFSEKNRSIFMLARSKSKNDDGGFDLRINTYLDKGFLKRI